MTEEQKLPPKRAYCALRKPVDDDRVWIDTGTLALLPELCKTSAQITDLDTPNWSKANPIVAIVAVDIKVVDVLERL
jgi:hypothetical protein